MNIKNALVLFLMLFFNLNADAALNPKEPRAINGILDLRNQSFEKEIKLNGEWVFYWHQLLNPGDTPPEGGILVDFPYRWNSSVLQKKKYPSFGYATYKLRLLLPPSDQPFLLTMVDTYTAYRLYINGKIASENGKVSTSAEGFVPH